MQSFGGAQRLSISSPLLCVSVYTTFKSHVQPTELDSVVGPTSESGRLYKLPPSPNSLSMPL